MGFGVGPRSEVREVSSGLDVLDFLEAAWTSFEYEDSEFGEGSGYAGGSDHRCGSSASKDDVVFSIERFRLVKDFDRVCGERESEEDR